jgi:CheY-like chemotaxis protein/PAS domain-containing protein
MMTMTNAATPSIASPASITVLAVGEFSRTPVFRWLSERARVQVVPTVAEAVVALRAERYDFVITPGGELSPLASIVGLESAETILDRIGQAVAIVDRDGHLVWGNQKLRAYGAAAIERVRETCSRIFVEFLAEPAPPPSVSARSEPRSRRRTVKVGDDLVLDVTVSPLCAPDGQIVEVVGILWDVTTAQQLQEKLNAIDAAGRELVHLNSDTLEAMSVPERLRFLEEKIINYSRDLMHFDHFAVRVLDKRTNRLDTVIAGGFSEEAKNLEIYGTLEGNGITGYVAASGRSYICPDIQKDPRYIQGLQNARSSVTVPLMLHDEVIGTLNVESDKIAAFSEHDRQFAEIFGRYIAMALQVLKLLVVERRSATGQIAADVAHELAAPLNDIITDATYILEEFIGHDDARRRLHAIMENVDRVKKSIQSLAEPKAVTGLIPAEQTEKDPILSGKRILIAEDEDVIRETVSDLLSRTGALTVMAPDGNDAIAMIRQQQFDLVITDIKMPCCSGYEVFAAAKKQNKDLPVIMITGFGYDPDHALVRASKEGLAGVLFKPFKVEDLLQNVRTALTPKG